jgi:hypothetical protein
MPLVRIKLTGNKSNLTIGSSAKGAARLAGIGEADNGDNRARGRGGVRAHLGLKSLAEPGGVGHGGLKSGECRGGAGRVRVVGARVWCGEGTRGVS